MWFRAEVVGVGPAAGLGLAIRTAYAQVRTARQLVVLGVLASTGYWRVLARRGCCVHAGDQRGARRARAREVGGRGDAQGVPRGDRLHPGGPPLKGLPHPAAPGRLQGGEGVGRGGRGSLKGARPSLGAWVRGVLGVLIVGYSGAPSHTRLIIGL